MLPVQGHVTRSNLLSLAIAASENQGIAMVTVNGNEAISVGPNLWSRDLSDWTAVPDFNGLRGSGGPMAYTNAIDANLHFRLRTWPLSP